MPWPNATFDPIAEVEWFREHGDRALWYQSALCTCGTAIGAPGDVARSLAACQACGGLGRVYPSAPVLIRGIVTAIEQTREVMELGMAIAGNLVWSADPYGPGPIAPYDLLILQLPDGRQFPFEGQVIVRGSGPSDALWYVAEGLTSVTVSDPTTGTVTDYTQYASVSGRTITFSGGGPAAGSQYSVRYLPRYEWVAFAPPMVRVEHGQSLGQRVLLRKRHEVVLFAPPLLEA